MTEYKYLYKEDKNIPKNNDNGNSKKLNKAISKMQSMDYEDIKNYNPEGLDSEETFLFNKDKNRLLRANKASDNANVFTTTNQDNKNQPNNNKQTGETNKAVDTTVNTNNPIESSPNDIINSVVGNKEKAKYISSENTSHSGMDKDAYYNDPFVKHIMDGMPLTEAYRRTHSQAEIPEYDDKLEKKNRFLKGINLLAGLAGIAGDVSATNHVGGGLHVSNDNVKKNADYIENNINKLRNEYLRERDTAIEANKLYRKGLWDSILKDYENRQQLTNTFVNNLKESDSYGYNSRDADVFMNGRDNYTRGAIARSGGGNNSSSIRSVIQGVPVTYTNQKEKDGVMSQALKSMNNEDKGWYERKLAEFKGSKMFDNYKGNDKNDVEKINVNDLFNTDRPETGIYRAFSDYIADDIERYISEKKTESPERKKFLENISNEIFGGKKWDWGKEDEETTNSKEAQLYNIPSLTNSK